MVSRAWNGAAIYIPASKVGRLRDQPDVFLEVADVNLAHSPSADWMAWNDIASGVGVSRHHISVKSTTMGTLLLA